MNAPVETAQPMNAPVETAQPMNAPVETAQPMNAPVEAIGGELKPQLITRQTFPELIQDIAYFKTQGFIGDLEVTQVLAANGLADITLLAARPDLVPQISAQLNASIKV